MDVCELIASMDTFNSTALQPVVSFRFVRGTEILNSHHHPQSLIDFISSLFIWIIHSAHLECFEFYLNRDTDGISLCFWCFFWIIHIHKFMRFLRAIEVCFFFQLFKFIAKFPYLCHPFFGASALLSWILWHNFQCERRWKPYKHLQVHNVNIPRNTHAQWTFSPTFYHGLDSTSSTGIHVNHFFLHSFFFCYINKSLSDKIQFYHKNSRRNFRFNRFSIENDETKKQIFFLKWKKKKNATKYGWTFWKKVFTLLWVWNFN